MFSTRVTEDSFTKNTDLFRLTVKLQDMLLLAKTPVNVVISNACVAKIKYFLKKCPRQLWNLEKIKDFLKYYSKRP